MLFCVIFFALTASVARTAPLILDKRIQQTIADSTAKWEQACLAAGGGLKCNPQSVTSFTTLLAAAGPCEQQDAADSMIQLAQSLNNDAEMIRLTQIFVQQPRNTPNSVSVPYCQKAPTSPLLSGLFQCQFQGASPTTFVGGLSVGAAGTVPFGLKSLSPLGSCKAHPSGPIADGTQLVDLTQDPGIGSSSNGSDSAAPSSSAPETSVGVEPTSTAGAPPAATSPSTSASSDFHLQNGLDAQKLNAQFKGLTASSSCTEGQQACVGTSFAQCVSGSFVLTPCASGTVCAALPLVNKQGTSISCDTMGDVAARIAATGATGGVDGSTNSETEDADAGSDSDSDCEDADSDSSAAAHITSSPTTTAAPSAGANFHVQNGLDAQKLNAQFKILTANSKCTDGEQACVGTSFAQCVAGSFVLSPCSGGLICAALPLVNKQGTSIACDSAADVEARITASGVVGGIAGL
ncbi:hypothetical protein MVEN_00999000 [Mycena venus]|uniref:Carbohydrate-binding module family 19 domain-containing protein n=1 Tax=Mycena venus TaxID=2733690 RepID=A0A8H6YEN4_9AGAR|nr:hypothetical protein MVEN_00999000 [Mycena venus]